jgi:5-(carboxyamino)imidazole ribonucleotide mutase
MTTSLVGILMGSESDLPVLEPCADVFSEFGVPFEMRVMSAHRTPAQVEAYASGAEARGMRVIIAAAGGAAHLAGVVAAYTMLPVVAVPIPTARMGGLDSLLSMVQMPGGVPVACMGLGKSGAKNAALLCVRMLAAGDPGLRRQLTDYVSAMGRSVAAQDASVQTWLNERR